MTTRSASALNRITKPGKPMGTLSRNQSGKSLIYRLLLNHAAMDVLDTPSFVRLLWDREKRLIEVIPLQRNPEPFSRQSRTIGRVSMAYGHTGQVGMAKYAAVWWGRTPTGRLPLHEDGGRYFLGPVPALNTYDGSP